MFIKGLILKENLLLGSLKRQFSKTSSLEMRRPPKEEYENNVFHTRKKTADPFDR